jgi:hypothetical protein
MAIVQYTKGIRIHRFVDNGRFGEMRNATSLSRNRPAYCPTIALLGSLGNAMLDPMVRNYEGPIAAGIGQLAAVLRGV